MSVNDDLREQIERNMTNHRPTDAQIVAIERLRASAKELGFLMVELCPPSRERSMAVSDLESALMRAVQSIVTTSDTGYTRVLQPARSAEEFIERYQPPIDKLNHGVWAFTFDGFCHAEDKEQGLLRCLLPATNLFCPDHQEIAERARLESVGDGPEA